MLCLYRTVQSLNPSVGKHIFLPQKRSDRLWCPLNLLLTEYWSSSPGVKWTGLEVNHSSPSSTDVTKEWRSTSSPSVCFHVMGRNNFTFLRRCKWRFNSVCRKYRILKKKFRAKTCYIAINILNSRSNQIPFRRSRNITS